MTALAAISDLAGRALNYAHLSFAADTADPEIGALLQASSERATAIRTQLLFFELEWVAIDDERAEQLLATDGLDFCRHHLRLERRYRPHLLSGPEERIASELSITGASAWGRLFDELSSAIRVQLPGAEESSTLDQALSNLFDPDREVRRGTAEAVTTALEPGLRTRAYIFNTLLQDKAVKDRLRSYPHWLATRNLANEASDESVQALIDAVKARYELPRRWYRTKARLLGIERLADYDRMAVVGSDDAEVGWEEGREIVLETFGSVSPQMRDIANRFLTGRWIDVPPREGKRGGAFSASTVPSVHPYVMLDRPAPRRDHPGARARARHPPVPGPRSGHLPSVHAADRGRDRIGVRRGAGLRAAARGDRRGGLAAGFAGRGDRGPDRNRLPPGCDEPVRA
jgi:oligoendopeptidase F